MFIVYWLSIFFDYYRGGDLGTDPDILKLVQEQTTVGLWSFGITENLFSNFSSMFLNPNIFFIYEKSPVTSLKSIMLPKIVLTFHCLNKLF